MGFIEHCSTDGDGSPNTLIQFPQVFSANGYRLIVGLGRLVVWIPGITANERDCYERVYP